MAYITKSNAKKMIRKLDEVTLDRIAEPVYKRSIYFFSKRENANLKGIRELFRDLEHFVDVYYRPIEVIDTYQYVYAETKPAYHLDSSCERLNSKFINILVPLDVQEKGHVEVLAFRKWYTEQTFDNVNDYIKKVQFRFIYVGELDPKTIEYDNSGVELQKDYSLAELEKEIEAILDEAEAYFENNPALRHLIYKYQKLTFLAYIRGPLKNNHSGLYDEDLKDFLRTYDGQFKKPLKERLIEYYRILFNPDMNFDGHLLDKMGFRPCFACLDR